MAQDIKIKDLAALLNTDHIELGRTLRTEFQCIGLFRVPDQRARWAIRQYLTDHDDMQAAYDLLREYTE